MYFEDVEFCYRAGKKGFKIGFNPDVSITHFSGASSKNPRFTQWKGEMQGLVKFSLNLILNFQTLQNILIHIHCLHQYVFVDLYRCLVYQSFWSFLI